MDKFQRIQLGTIESLVAELTDRLGNISDLATHDPRYTVVRLSDGEKLYDDEPASLVVLMAVYCQIDTVTVCTVEGDHELFVKLTITSDTPYLNCGKFRID